MHASDPVYTSRYTRLSFNIALHINFASEKRLTCQLPLIEMVARQGMQYDEIILFSVDDYTWQYCQSA
jgi:hypothetical protein